MRCGVVVGLASPEKFHRQWRAVSPTIRLRMRQRRLSIAKLTAVTCFTLWVATACSSGPRRGAAVTPPVAAPATAIQPSAPKPQRTTPAHDTLERKIMVGYQGWF